MLFFSTERLPGKSPKPSECISQWEILHSKTPSYQLESEKFAQFVSQIKTWDGKSALRLPTGDIQDKKILILVVGSVYLVGDVLKVISFPLFAFQLVVF